MERTVLAQDVQRILMQSDKILDLNRKILDFMLKMKNPGMLTDFRSDIDNPIKDLDPDSVLKNVMGA